MSRKQPYALLTSKEFRRFSIMIEMARSTNKPAFNVILEKGCVYWGHAEVTYISI